MKIRALVSGVLFFFCFVFPLARAGEPLFKIEAVFDQNSVKSGMMFLAHVRVTNTSGDTSTDFWGNTCSYEKHWVTDDPRVSIQSWTCNENALEEITLAPGEAYEKNIILYISQNDKTEPVTFRMGFKRMSENGDIAEPLWSDPLTMNVIGPEEMKETAPVSGGDSQSAAVSEALDETASVGEAPATESGDEKPVSPVVEPGEESTPATSSVTDDGALVFKDPAVPIKVRPGEEFSIALVSNPSTGFRWEMTLPEGNNTVTFLGSNHVVSSEVMPGVPGIEFFKYKAVAPGESTAAFVYRRSWETLAAPARKIFTILVQEN